ncbi:MAG: DNA mismatch repair protein MutS, partial [Eubacteriales bacterium]
MPLTPMMQQYLEIKDQNKDAILFFRIGDFYEMFYDDAKTASRELELTLTGKDCGEEERAPMCGVPYHAAENYINRLVAKGYKVVVCEQMEDPALAKGLVKRDIVRIITPGTMLDTSQIAEGKNNYLCAVSMTPDGSDAHFSDIAAAFVDISTGDISATHFSGHADIKRLINELSTYSPSEILFDCDSGDYPQLCEYIKNRAGALVWNSQSARFNYTRSSALCRNTFKDDISEETLADMPLVSVVGALLDYIAETQKLDVSYIKKLNVYTDGQFLELDSSTRRSLELTENMRRGEKRGSLLWVLDQTRTSMGARLLRKWVELPLVNTYYITRRQNAVAELAADVVLRGELAEAMRGVLDLERLMAKIVYGTAGGRDLVAVRATLELLPPIKALLSNAASDELSSIRDNLDVLCDIKELIANSIVDEPPFTIREGGIIRPGYNSDIDSLHDIMHGGHGIIEKIESEERSATGIPKLKVGYNRVFGYYIEVTKSYVSSVPDRYIRKQTLANCERYITKELKDAETTVLGASDRAVALEYDIFCSVRTAVADAVSRIQKSASFIALLDAYLSLAEVAVKNNYVRPLVEYGDAIRIRDGRHPVVEHFASDSYFVPNDTTLDTSDNRMLLITGPNMAGKSTYMRQVALIVIMAQIGSFVPATDAEISVTDKIFTRVGASDDLASGQSTFMLEMNEVAYILKNATRRSLIIYDEIGRGTSTYDGMSIARAVVEYTAGRKLGAKTLFATHYHELTALEGECSGVVNYNIAAKKRGDEVTFLRKIVRGAADDSYGIEVAKL